MERESYKIGWICALTTELTAAISMLDEEHVSLPTADGNVYTFGRIGFHNVIIAGLPDGVTGITSAARVAERIHQTFKSLEFALMVGVGGGAPSEEHDIRLGDIVVSRPGPEFGGVVQYDFGKVRQGGRFERTGTLNRPPDILLNVVNDLKARQPLEDSRLPTILAKCIEKYPGRQEACTYPKDKPGIEDVLFKASYNHPKKQPTCANCDKKQHVRRDPRKSNDPKVHYGLIASANEVMRDGRTRERLRKQYNILCFEMEAAGLMDAFPCLVIRGICDYADGHKNKKWQDYAAAVAAAYAKDLILRVPTEEVDPRLLTFAENVKVKELSPATQVARHSDSLPDQNALHSNTVSSEGSSIMAGADSIPSSQTSPDRNRIQNKVLTLASASWKSMTFQEGAIQYLNLRSPHSPRVNSPTKQLEAALKDFRAVLSPEDRAQIDDLTTECHNQTVQAVISHAISARNKQAEGRGARMVLRIQGFLESVQEFSEAVDSFSDVEKLGATVRNSMQVFVHIVTKSTVFLRRLVECLNSVQEWCPRFANYTFCYHGRDELKVALCCYYAEFFEFLAHTLRAAEYTKEPQNLATITILFDTEFQNLAKNLKHAGRNVSHWIDTTNRGSLAVTPQRDFSPFKRASLAFDKWKRDSMGRTKSLKPNWQRWKSLLESLSSNRHQTIWKELKAKAIYGVKGSWFVKTNEYQLWRSSSLSSCFLLNGKLGTGKSVTCVDAMDELILSYHGYVTASVFYFCEPGVTCESFLRSTCKQLFTQLPDPEREHQCLETLFQDSDHPSEDELRDFILLISKKITALFILVDGLDQCTHAVRKEILYSLTLMLNNKPTTPLSPGSSSLQQSSEPPHFCKVLVNCRNGVIDAVKQAVQPSYCKTTDCSEARVGLRESVELLLEDMQDDNITRINDMQLLKEVRDSLVQNADDMILWATLMIDEVYAQKSNSDIRRVIHSQHLPKTIFGVYDLALGRIIRDGNVIEARALFKWVTCARRALSQNEIQEAITIVPGSSSKFKEDDQPRIPNSVSGWTSNLLVVDPENKLVQFTHHSLREYLLTPEGGNTQSSFRCIWRESNRHLGRLCVTYLNFRELKGEMMRCAESGSAPPTPSSPRKSMSALMQPMVERVASSSFESPVVAAGWTRLYGLIVKSMIAYKRNRTSKEMTGSASSAIDQTATKIIQRLQQQYRLLPYISEFWLDHTCDFQKEDKLFYNLWYDLIHSSMAIVALPWAPEAWTENPARILREATIRNHIALAIEIWGQSNLPISWIEQEDNIEFILGAANSSLHTVSWISPDDNFWNAKWLQLLRSTRSKDAITKLFRSQGIKIDKNDSLNAFQLRSMDTALLRLTESDEYDQSQTLELLRLSVSVYSQLRWPGNVNYLAAAAANNNVLFLDSFLQVIEENEFPTHYACLMDIRRLQCYACQALVVVAAEPATNKADDAFIKVLQIILSSRFKEDFEIFEEFCHDYLATALILVAGSGRYWSVEKIFIYSKLNVNSRPRRFPNCPTALMAAASGDHWEVVDYLLKAGADIALQDFEQKTAMDYARTAVLKEKLSDYAEQFREELSHKRASGSVWDDEATWG